MLVTKPIDLPLLDRELTTAGVPHTGLGLSGTLPETPSQQDLYQYTADGLPTELPPEAVPVVNAHTAPPRVVEFSDDQRLDAIARTTDATAVQIVRMTLDPQSGYTGQVSVIGVDGGNGAVRVIRASFAVKRLNAGALAVGAPVVVASHGDAAASSWTVAMSVSGNDAIVSVTGGAGRTIDWLCRGEMTRFAPGGLG